METIDRERCDRTDSCSKRFGVSGFCRMTKLAHLSWHKRVLQHVRIPYYTSCVQIHNALDSQWLFFLYCRRFCSRRQSSDITWTARDRVYRENGTAQSRKYCRWFSAWLIYRILKQNRGSVLILRFTLTVNVKRFLLIETI